ncbi:ABC transporter permease subunit [Spirillospora sp. CA-108201]
MNLLDMDLLDRALPLLGPAIMMTLLPGLVSFALGCVLGLLLSLARLSGRRPLVLLSIAYVSVFRGTPLLIQILVIYFGLPQLGIQLGAFLSAVTALTLHTAAYLSENFRAGFMAVDRGQWEAADSLGMSYMEMFLIAGVIYWLMNAALSIGQAVVERRMGKAYA